MAQVVIRMVGLWLCCVGMVWGATPEEEMKDQVCSLLPSLEGWCTREKALTLVDLVLEREPQVCVEIGVFGGASFYPIASALKLVGKGVAIGIDPWDRNEMILNLDPVQDQGHIRWWSKVNMDRILSNFNAMLKRLELGRFAIAIRATSEQAAWLISEIDFLHIDGNHSEVNSLQDVALYLPKVRAGGVVVYHDALWPERQRALEVLMESCEVIDLIDNGNCIVLEKRAP